MSHDKSPVIIGVDVGGTFTDLVSLDRESGRVKLSKVPTTLDNQAFGVLDALRSVGAVLDRVGLIVHGTTTTTNAVLERKLSRTGLITTAGFRDVLELGRRTRPQAYGMTGVFRPIIPRDLRLEVPERLDAEGKIVCALDQDEVRKAGKLLLSKGCEAVVVHFLHCYANPAHELEAADVLAEVWPNTHITLGHQILQETREFERGVTASVNASVQPILDKYLQSLMRELSQSGYERDVLVMNGNGGMVSARTAARQAVKTVMSGPASGVMAAAYTGQMSGVRNLITYDMGGTSTDVALIRDGLPSISNEIELEYAMPIHVPMVDVRTVGAGGGSIARVNASGLLDVGPESAGATPGPICYGRGGTKPTLSDANLLLGRLDPSRLAQTKNVQTDDVKEIFSSEIADPLGIDVVTAAKAVVHMANTKMAGAIRMVSLSLGVDPRDFVLFAFGGAGPLHACALARELGIPRVLVPARPGITNAIGCAVADVRHDFVQAINRSVSDLSKAALSDVFSAQAAKGKALLDEEPVELSQVRTVFSVDMQFVGQTHVLRVDLDEPTTSAEDIQAKFEDVYFDRFKVRLPGLQAHVVTANTSVIGVRPPLDLATLLDPKDRKATVAEAKSETRDVCFETGWCETPVYIRDHLPLAFEIQGPAVIVQMDSTILVEPGFNAHGDALGNIFLEAEADE